MKPWKYDLKQLKKWLNWWSTVMDHSMKQDKEMAQTQTIPIWRHYTAERPAKTKTKRRIPTRKHVLPKRMLNNPLTNVFSRINRSKSTSKAPSTVQKKYRANNILTRMFKTLGKKRSTSRV